jgi:hypothetical protein
LSAKWELQAQEGLMKAEQLKNMLAESAAWQAQDEAEEAAATPEARVRELEGKLLGEQAKVAELDLQVCTLHSRAALTDECLVLAKPSMLHLPLMVYIHIYNCPFLCMFGFVQYVTHLSAYELYRPFRRLWSFRMRCGKLGQLHRGVRGIRGRWVKRRDLLLPRVVHPVGTQGGGFVSVCVLNFDATRHRHSSESVSTPRLPVLWWLRPSFDMVAESRHILLEPAIQIKCADFICRT